MHFEPGDEELDFSPVTDSYLEGKTAMIRVTAAMAIFSEEGQKAVAAGTSVLSYNKEVHIEARDSLQFVQDCIVPVFRIGWC